MKPTMIFEMFKYCLNFCQALTNLAKLVMISICFEHHNPTKTRFTEFFDTFYILFFSEKKRKKFVLLINVTQNGGQFPFVQGRP